MAKIYLKAHKTEHGDMIAMCDEKMLGRVYSDKKTGTTLDLDKYRDFYEGALVYPKDAVDTLLGADIYTCNIVGEDSVGAAIKAGLATDSDIKAIGGVPSLQVYKIIQ